MLVDLHIWLLNISKSSKPVHWTGLHLGWMTWVFLTTFLAPSGRCISARSLWSSLNLGRKLWWKWWISYGWWTKSCTTKDDDYPIVYRVLTIPGDAGFCPSTVWFPFWKELYDALGRMIENDVLWLRGVSKKIPQLISNLFSEFPVGYLRFLWGSSP